MEKAPRVYPGEIVHLYDVIPTFDSQTGAYTINVNERLLDDIRKALELLYNNRAAARNTPKKREARRIEGDRVFVQYRIVQPDIFKNVEPKVLKCNIVGNEVLCKEKKVVPEVQKPIPTQVPVQQPMRQVPVQQPVRQLPIQVPIATRPMSPVIATIRNPDGSLTHETRNGYIDVPVKHS